MELIPVKYKFFSTKKSFVYYIEQRMNNQEQMKWFIAIPGDKFFDFHFSTFIYFKDGFDCPENALIELKKYIGA